MKVDSSFLTQYGQDLDESFRAYLEDIVPFIVLFESQKSEFPIELQNEIRAMYAHLARAAIAETPEQAQRNVYKIKSHTKRALLDCYKYSCLISYDNYTDFFKRYEGVDLSYLDQGRFLPEVQTHFNRAKAAHFAAKSAETSNISEGQLFELYQDAYNQFASLDEKLRSVEEDAAYLQHKATRKDQLAKVSFAVGIVGTVVGIIGLIVALL